MSPKKKTRHRRLFQFTLDILKPSQNELAEYCDWLTEQGKKNPRGGVSLAGAIRDGLRLVGELNEGCFDFLFERFPHVKVDLFEYFFGEFQAQLMQQMATMAPVASGEGVARARLSAPVTFDIGDEIEIKKATSSEDSAKNFTISMAMLQGERGVEELPLDILQYGVKANKFHGKLLDVARSRVDHMSNNVASATKEAPQEPQGLKKIAGADIDLAPPSFDDLDMDW